MSQEDKAKLEELKRVILFVAKEAKVALDWETFGDLSRRAKKEEENAG